MFEHALTIVLCTWLCTKVRWTLEAVLCPVSCTVQTRKPRLVMYRPAAHSRLALPWTSGYAALILIVLQTPLLHCCSEP